VIDSTCALRHNRPVQTTAPSKKASAICLLLCAGFMGCGDASNGGGSGAGQSGGAAGSGEQPAVDGSQEDRVPADPDASSVDVTDSGQIVQSDTPVRPDAAGDGSLADILSSCSAYAQSYCSRFLACASVRFHVSYGTLDTCERRIAEFCPFEFNAIEAKLTPRFLGNCAQAISGQSCSEWLTSIPPACVSLGTLTDGAGCEYDSQCQSGFCSRATLSWCGVCRTRFKLGETCDPHQRSCEMGLLCAGYCQATDAGTCASVSWKCAAPGGEGNTCVAAEECARGLICLQGKCETPSQAQQTCRATSDCDATKDLYCIASGGGNICAAVSYASTGQACDYPNGVICSTQGSCLGPTGASASQGTCGPIANDGQSCDSLRPCLPPVLCVSGVCRGPVPPSSCP
jgi:hypothetical protein